MLYATIFLSSAPALHHPYDAREEIHSRHALPIALVVIAKLLNKTLVFLPGAYIDDHRTYDTKHPK
jgi:hypothetical protein